MYSLLDLETLESFLKSFKELYRVDPENAKLISNEQSVIRERMKQKQLKSKLGNDFITVYHGTGIDKYHKILADGFQLTKGERSGFMGSSYQVDNQGIFLTDSRLVARYFGDNRSPNNSDVFTAYISPITLLNMTKVPSKLRLKAKEILVPHSGEERINQGNVWWLLDHKEFVDEIKQLGYKGVYFKESISIRREAGDINALTYFIINPNDILLDKHATPKFDVEDYYKHIKSLLGNKQ